MKPAYPPYTPNVVILGRILRDGRIQLIMRTSLGTTFSKTFSLM